MIFLRYFFLNRGINFVYRLCIKFLLARLRATYVNVRFTKKLKRMFTKKLQDNLIKNFEKHFLVQMLEFIPFWKGKNVI